MMWGMRSLPMMIGADRIISSTTRNVSVGSVMGKYCDRFSISPAKLLIKTQKSKDLITNRFFFTNFAHKL